MNNLYQLFGRAGFAVGLCATPFGRCFAPASLWLPSLTLLLYSSLLLAQQPFKTNERTANDIYLATAARGNLNYTPEQIATLQGVASQCPLACGSAVFKARALLSIVEDTDYDDYAICNAMGLQPMMRPNEGDTSSEFKVFPNPASSELQVVYKTTTACKISLTDVFGREVLSQVLPIEAKNATLLVANLPNGMYFCQITNARGDTEYASNILIIK